MVQEKRTHGNERTKIEYTKIEYTKIEYTKIEGTKSGGEPSTVVSRLTFL
jgi:hypothetical protein